VIRKYVLATVAEHLLEGPVLVVAVCKQIDGTS